MASSKKRGTASGGAKKKAPGKLAKVKAAIRKAVTPKKSRNTGSKGGAKKAAGRPVRRESDIPAQELPTRVPAQQSAKGPFDKHRAENLRDADAMRGFTNTNERFSEQDQYTNRTGDPRIGTRKKRS